MRRYETIPSAATPGRDFILYRLHKGDELHISMTVKRCEARVESGLKMHLVHGRDALRVLGECSTLSVQSQCIGGVTHTVARFKSLANAA